MDELQNDGISSHGWASQDLVLNPPMAEEKRQSFHKGLMRMMRGGESLPLTLQFSELTFLPGQSSIIQSQVAPPGYVVGDPKAPKGANSRLSKRKSTLSQEIINSSDGSRCSLSSQYAVETLDLVILISLTCKNGLRAERRHKIQLSTGSAKDILMMVHHKCRLLLRQSVAQMLRK